MVANLDRKLLKHIKLVTIYDFLKSEYESTDASFFSTLDYRFLQFYPSMVAAGVVCTALSYLHSSDAWTLKMEEITGYSKQNLDHVVELLHLTSAAS